MRIRIDEFLENIESYAKDTGYDYTYYLISHELKRMRITETFGKLEFEHMSPILLFLRDWMPSGWGGWTERTKKRWQMDSQLSKTLNELSSDLDFLHDLDLKYFDHNLHGSAVRRIFESISDLRFAKSEEAIATVTSKIIHLLNPKLFVMWDTGVINHLGFQPNADGYVEFLVDMKEVGKHLRQYLGKINKKAEELRKKSCEVYGEEICSEKSLAKLIDENNWIRTRRYKGNYR